MPYKDLQDFISTLQNKKEIKVIEKSVDPILEVAEITTRICKRHGPALLFKNLQGHNFPILTNSFGSINRMALALEISNFDQLSERIAIFLEQDKQQTVNNTKSAPVIVQRAQCHDITLYGDKVDLSIIPALKCWPRDAGPAITLPVVFTKDPLTGNRNAGMYRMQIYGKNLTGMHWQPNTGGAKHYKIAGRLGQSLEVAVAIGPDPAMTYAATAPLPDDIDEVLFAGFLRNAPVELVKCKTVDLEVPASSQIVLEGYVKPGERQTEGPFGNHTGYYSPAEEYPVFHITCMTMRKDAVYHATVVGPPPQEDCFLAKASERLFLALLKKEIPEIVDINLPIEGIFNNLAFISIEKRYPGHAKEVIMTLWNLGSMMLRKIICIFDKEVNVQNLSEILWKLGNNIDPKRDIVFAYGPVDPLNPASSHQGYGSKMGIDCTRKSKAEGLERAWPETMKMSQKVKKRIDQLWSRLGMD